MLLLVAFCAVIGVAWAYLVRDAMSMSELASMAAMMETRPRGMLDFVHLLIMWAVMMAAMMLPSAVPMVMVYAAMARRASPSARGAWWIAAFVVGYIIVWSAYSAFAALFQVWIERLALLSPTMVSASPVLGAILLAVAGVFQLSPAKEACLRRCRGPVQFLAENWRPGAAGAIQMGLLHGAYCVGCCWALMGLLFVLGVMNLLWVAALAAFVMLEKVAFMGSTLGRRLTGWALIAAAAAMLAARF